jgi:hypothetical protein
VRLCRGDGSGALREAVATKTDIAELRHEIQHAIRDMTIRVVGCLSMKAGRLAAEKASWFGSGFTVASNVTV